MVIALASTPLLRVTLRQIDLMTPEPLDWAVYRALAERIRRTPVIAGIDQALVSLARAPDARLDLAPLQARDPANGLYDYLHLLGQLQHNDGAQNRESAGPEQQVLDALDRCLTSKPATIHARQERQITEDVLREHGLPQRLIAAHASDMPYVVPGVRGHSVTVIRQLTDQLIERARTWRDRARVREADTACRAVVRLLTDLLEDDASLELALLASEKLPPALRQLGAEAEAGQAAAFRECLHAFADQDGLNLLPWTGDQVLARQQHDRAVGALIVSGTSCIAWAMLVIVCLLLVTVVTIVRPPTDTSLQWRWPGWAPCVAAAITSAPVLMAALLIVVMDIPFAWLISKPSAPVLVFVPAAMLVSLGLATWLCIRPTNTAGHWRVPRSVVWAMAAVLFVTLVGGVLLPIVGREPWRQPPAIQRLRLLGPVLGAQCAVLSVVWIVWGIKRRRKANVAAGVWARPTLAVAAAGLLGLSVISSVALAINGINDRRHEQAFVRAAGDPIADQLGEDWRERHFHPARRFIDAVSNSLHVDAL